MTNLKELTGIYVTWGNFTTVFVTIIIALVGISLTLLGDQEKKLQEELTRMNENLIKAISDIRADMAERSATMGELLVRESSNSIEFYQKEMIMMRGEIKEMQSRIMAFISESENRQKDRNSKVNDRVDDLWSLVLQGNIACSLVSGQLPEE